MYFRMNFCFYESIRDTLRNTEKASNQDEHVKVNKKTKLQRSSLLLFFSFHTFFSDACGVYERCGVS